MGRPAQFGEPATVRIVVRVTPAQAADLRQVAQDNLTDVAGAIRQAVNEYVADYRERLVFRLPKSNRRVVM